MPRVISPPTYPAAQPSADILPRESLSASSGRNAAIKLSPVPKATFDRVRTTAPNQTAPGPTKASKATQTMQVNVDKNSNFFFAALASDMVPIMGAVTTLIRLETQIEPVSTAAPAP